ncbi:hypothetical protein BJ138DRAFT_1130978 [Hygrophoropsis aurantiaca]|uniref:Uncharacterized protein n=1 Tax=Hygrophoropsis aurantiaca TaxID=72124 RepID=A0ACB7ZT50_9AGAM|nr:hypothetical protein BJ138DRAFT_1130978 [Hygrophoropsis aurantiaca]
MDSAPPALSANFYSELQGFINHAQCNKTNESRMYGAINHILYTFCRSATVQAKNFENLGLGCFPQYSLKAPVGRKHRSPDFLASVIQKGKLLTDRNETFGTGAFICEVKVSRDKKAQWFSQARLKPSTPFFIRSFIPHFTQIREQAEYARDMFGSRPVYILLTVDVWFVLFKFSNKPGSQSEFRDNLIMEPHPIFDETCESFSPEFLKALHACISDVSTGMTIESRASLFQAPESESGSSDSESDTDSAKVRLEPFKTAIDNVEKRRAANEKAALEEAEDKPDKEDKTDGAYKVTGNRQNLALPGPSGPPRRSARNASSQPGPQTTQD